MESSMKSKESIFFLRRPGLNVYEKKEEFVSNRKQYPSAFMQFHYLLMYLSLSPELSKRNNLLQILLEKLSKQSLVSINMKTDFYIS